MGGRAWSLGGFLVASLVCGAGAGRADQVDEATQPFALTISGGVSLGSYEAGVNWALLQILRTAPRDVTLGRPALVGVTGASAGSINALLTAMHWCSPQSANGTTDIDRNLFAEAWLPIGLRELTPTLARYGDGGGRHPPDALLSRAAFQNILEHVRHELARPIFTPGCGMTIGLIVTRIVPGRTEEAGISAENQRFVIPLHAFVDPRGRMRFRNDARRMRRDLVGRVVYLRNPGERAIADNPARLDLRADTVLAAVLASSAFPLALGPVKLDYYSRDKDCGRESGSLYRPCEDWFVDGGIFDNIPLGVAVAQAERPDVIDRTARPITYLYVDSANTRRNAGRASAETRAGTNADCTDVRERPISRSLGCWMRTLSGAVATARSYELNNVLRLNAWNRGSPSVARDAAARLRGLDGGSGVDFKPAMQACLRGLEGPLKPVGGTPACAPPDRDALETVLRCKGDAADQRPFLLAAAHQLEAWATELERARLDVASTRCQHETIRGGILRLLSLMPELVSEADDSNPGEPVTLDAVAAEAHLLSVDPGRERLLYPSRRFFPLASTYFFNFSGFLDPPLRRYDYYVGVYDAMHSTAVALCERRHRLAGKRSGEAFLARREVEKCVSDWMATIRARLGLTGGEVGRFLTTLWAVERGYWRPGNHRPPAITGNRPLFQILRVLAMPDGATLQVEESSLQAMLTGLRAQGYRPETAQMASAMRDPEQWWLSTAEHAFARQGQLESASGMRYLMLAGERLMGTTALASDPGLFIQPASIPELRARDRRWQWLRLAPMHVASSLSADRWLEAAWQAGVAGPDARAGLEPRIWMREGTPNLDIGFFASRHAVSPLKQLYLSSGGVSLAYTAIPGERDGLRAELFGTSLITTLRLAIGHQASFDPDADGFTYVTIGIAELPSSLYTVWHLP